MSDYEVILHVSAASCWCFSIKRNSYNVKKHKHLCAIQQISVLVVIHALTVISPLMTKPLWRGAMGGGGASSFGVTRLLVSY